MFFNHSVAQCAKQEDPIGQTSSLNLTFGLCAGASPLSSRYPADKYMNVLGICSAITAKSSEALADIPGYPVSPVFPFLPYILRILQ